MIKNASAQGIERESLSGTSVADQLRQSGVDQAYNLRLGPVTLRVEADTSLTFNDNIGLSKENRLADITFTPSAILHARWQVSDLNSVNLDLGVGYEIYLFNSGLSDFIVTPDSDAEFNFFVGDVAFNVHDFFSYQQDPTAVGQLSNQTRLSRWQNDAGISAKWDLGDVTLSLGYDHANLWVTQSAYEYLTNASDTITPKVSVKVDASINAGIEMSLSTVRYEEGFQNNYDTISVGPFVSAQISTNLSVQGRIGGYFAFYDTGGGNGDTEDVSSFYGSAGVNHRINDSMNESLTIGREYLPGLTSNFTERVYANYMFNWQTTKTINLGTNLFWENLNDSAGAFSQQSDRYGVGLNAEDRLNEHLTLSFNYQFLIKESDPDIFSYYQNTATFGLNYQF